jgi:formylglycine-generating enzyme required for sulfatase activity
MVGSFTLAPARSHAQHRESFTNSIGMKLVLIPSGEFMMGAEEDRDDTLDFFPYLDPKELDGELPWHRVRITKSFYMGQTEVTLAQFRTFCDSAEYKIEIERDGKPSRGLARGRSADYRPWAPGWSIESDHPAVYVSWNDAVAFCKWLSEREGRLYRLPTEAEWEYACRAGTSSRYFFGDDPEELVNYANAADQTRKASRGVSLIEVIDRQGNESDTNAPFPSLSGRDGYDWTAPVGKFKPNDFGLYDMHGNVWEWVYDWFSTDYYGKSPIDDPQGPLNGTSRVARGGSYSYVPGNSRCAYRASAPQSDRSDNLGFRVVSEDVNTSFQAVPEPVASSAGIAASRNCSSSFAIKSRRLLRCRWYRHSTFYSACRRRR